MILDEPADLAVSARTRFLGCAVMRTRVRTCANMHNVRTWYAPTRQICRFIKEQEPQLILYSKNETTACFSLFLAQYSRLWYWTGIFGDIQWY